MKNPSEVVERVTYEHNDHGVLVIRDSVVQFEQTDTHCFFHGGRLSNWFMRPFVVDGMTFKCVEQFMMYGKAILFKDNFAAAAIMKATHPMHMKKLGRAVSGFKTPVWDTYGPEIVFMGNCAKYNQHADLAGTLMQTYGRLVEASATDQYWGIKLGMGDCRKYDVRSWQGLNMQGETLDRVRDQLKVDL